MGIWAVGLARGERDLSGAKVSFVAYVNTV